MSRSFIPHILTVIALVIATISAPAIAADEDAVATVNGVAIPKSQFDLLLNSQVSQGQQDTPAFREELREIMITREVLAQEAKQREMDQTPEFKAQIAAMEQQLLITALFNQIIKEMEPTQEALQAQYEHLKEVSEKMGDKEYEVRHILVEDEAQAKEIIVKLDNGADFGEMAKEYSTDTGSKDNGGDLGWASPERYVKPFSDAMVKLGKGQRSESPVKSNFGYHIIEVVDVRVKPFPPYEQVKDQLRKEMLTASRDELISKWRDEAKIEKVGDLGSEK